MQYSTSLLEMLAQERSAALREENQRLAIGRELAKPARPRRAWFNIRGLATTRRPDQSTVTAGR